MDINEEDDMTALYDKELKDQNYNYDCFSYSLGKRPNYKFIDDNCMLIKHDFNHFCYETCSSLNLVCDEAKQLYNMELCFKVFASNKQFITYGDIFKQCDLQMKMFLDNFIREHKLNLNYKELLCNHVFFEGLDEETICGKIIYTLSCGS